MYRVETQDVILREVNAERIIEVGPSPILTNMMKRTAEAKFADSDQARNINRQILAPQKNTAEIYYKHEAVEEAQESEPKASADVQPCEDTAAKLQQPQPVFTTPASAAVEIGDADVPVSAILLSILAPKLKKNPESIHMTGTISYGPTEACVFACGRDIEVEAIDTKSTNIGRPVGINAWIISPMTGSICPIGAPGELCLESHTLARGYHNDPSFHSSTVQLYWRDRKGYGQPEITALLRIDMLHDETVHEVPCTFLSMTSKIPTSTKASQLQYRLRRLLPEYMIPSIFIAVAHFPTTASGKLDKDFAQGCIEYLLAQGQQEVEQNETWSVAETCVREWWSTILGVDVSLISRHENFFVLGGNSIHAIRLVGLARSKSYRLQYEDIFSSPALVDMVSRLLPIGHDDENKSELLSSPEPFELISEPDLKSVFDTVLPSHNISKNEVEDVYPCTALQESLMVETARHRGAYMLVETVEVPASQVTHFQDVWFAVFNVYEILRTTIVLSHGQQHGAWQVVMKSHPLRWTEFPDVDSFIEFAYDSHDYGKPLVQLGIIDDSDKAVKEGKQNVVRFGFCIHHAAYDGWSLSNIWQRIYQELSESPPSYSFNHVTPYKSFIRNLIQQTSEQAIAYWGERFAGLSNTRLIPRSSHTEHRPLATDSTQRAVQLSRLHDQSHLQGKTATIAQAAWAMTICHYTANNDTVFGTILSGRESVAGSISGIEAIAGPTIVTVPSRTVINYGSSVSDLVAVVQRNNLSAIRFSHIGLEQISRIDQDCRQACQFDSIFVVQPPLDKAMGTTSTGVVRQTVDTRGFFSSPMTVEVQLSAYGEEVTVTMSFDPIIVSVSVYLGHSHGR